MQLSRHSTATRFQRGMSLVELMIGIAIGMIVVAGASLLMTNQVNEHSKLMQETQIQQDLRATADLMLRDLRRAGFWAQPEKAVWVPGDTVLLSNRYAPASATDTSVTYAYSKSEDLGNKESNSENNEVDGNESFGFRLHANGTLQSQLGQGNWQPLTDPETLKIREFTVTPVEQTVSLAEYCNPPCDVSSGTCPTLNIRRFDIRLVGESARDSKVIRTITVSSRVRNDEVLGACPAPAP